MLNRTSRRKNYLSPERRNTEENLFKSNPQCNIFRKFLIKENMNDFTPEEDKIAKGKDIIPAYNNIKIQISKKFNDIRSYFDIKNSIFQEMPVQKNFYYSYFTKGMRQFFFGPKGKISTTNTLFRKNKGNHKKHPGLESKIYAGSLDYYDFLSSYNSYFERLKFSRKKILSMGGNFTTADSMSDKLHSIYLKSKNIKNAPRFSTVELKERRKSILKEAKSGNTNLLKIKINSNKNKSTIHRNQNRKFIESYTNNNKKENKSIIFNKVNPNNFFAYTSINPSDYISTQRESENKFRNSTNPMGSTYSTGFKTNNDNDNKNKSSYSDKYSEENKINFTPYQTFYHKKGFLLKEYIQKKLNSERRQKLKKLKLTLKSKIDSFEKPSEDFKNNVDFLCTSENFLKLDIEKKNKLKEDFKVIGEDDKKKNFINSNLDTVVNSRSSNQNKDRISQSVPIKIFYCYYDQGDNYKSIQEFVKNIGKNKKEEKEKKSNQTIRQRFKMKCDAMNHLGFSLDIIKKNSKLL